jgi:hypothetical protein
MGWVVAQADKASADMPEAKNLLKSRIFTLS